MSQLISELADEVAGALRADHGRGVALARHAHCDTSGIMMPALGQVVGSFVLLRQISSGAMGSVWIAKHPALHQDVAVKFLATTLDEPAAALRFALEAHAVIGISSPHVPKVFAHGTCDDGTPYLVMELVGGTDLKGWVAEHGCMTLAQLARLVEHVCLAMSAAHEVGIVHRDIKPENIVLRGGVDDFHATLVDFGISKSTMLSLSGPRLTLAGETLGTPSYMSPEQLLSAGGVDERADIWSLGVVAYWALTAELPFRGESFRDICQAIQHGHFALISEIKTGLPIALDGWFTRVLSRDVEDRIQSAALMIGMLRIALARPEEWTQPMPVAALRRPLVEPLVVASVRHAAAALRFGPPRRVGRATWSMAAGAIGALIVVGAIRARASRSTERDARAVVATTMASGAESGGRLPSAPLAPATVSVETRAQRPFLALPDANARTSMSRTRETPAETKESVAARRARAVTVAGVLSSPTLPWSSSSRDASATRVEPGDWHPRDEIGEP